MLQLTRSAAVRIDQLVAAAALGPYGGLRIAPSDEHLGVAMSLVDGPGPDDIVLPAASAHLFLAPPAARRLADGTLDLRDDSGGTAFYLA